MVAALVCSSLILNSTFFLDNVNGTLLRVEVSQ